MLRGRVHSGFNVHRSRRVLPGEREDLKCHEPALSPRPTCPLEQTLRWGLRFLREHLCSPQALPPPPQLRLQPPGPQPTIRRTIFTRSPCGERRLPYQLSPTHTNTRLFHAPPFQVATKSRFSHSASRLPLPSSHTDTPTRLPLYPSITRDARPASGRPPRPIRSIVPTPLISHRR
jgi:hypothetical protein